MRTIPDSTDSGQRATVTSMKRHSSSGQLSRRSFLTTVGLVSATAAAGVTTACASGEAGTDGSADQQGADRPDPVVPFDGPHQAGIATPVQAHNTTVAFTLRDGVGPKEVRRLLSIWTSDARRMCSGEPVLADLEPELSSDPGRLTVTCGFGRGLFTAAGVADRAPRWLGPLPAFSTDRLDPRWGERDLVIQVCGDDRTTVSHALRILVRGGADYARPSWTQTGFLDVPVGPDGEPGTPRNLFGFKDGTVNPRTDTDFDEQVWIDDAEASHPAHVGGTCMVIRRVAFDMPLWESADRTTREVSMGRTITEGAPLTGRAEFDEPDLAAIGDDGLPVIDAHAHIALAGVHDGDTRQRMLRRAYNYDLPVTAARADGLEDADLVALADTGLIFTCFQTDPRTSFIPVQRRLADGDRLNEWISHVGSAVFFIPPGTAEGEYWGEKLLG